MSIEQNTDVLVKNKRGEWVPAIPEPYYLLFRKECYPVCGKKFWTKEGYEGHFALKHILGL